MTNTFRAFKERPLRLLTFETFDQSDEKPWPDQKNNDKDNHDDKYIYIYTPHRKIFEDIFNTFKWQS